MVSDAALEVMKRKLKDAVREHEQALDDAVARFYKLTPEEQMREELRNWEALLRAER